MIIPIKNNLFSYVLLIFIIIIPGKIIAQTDFEFPKIAEVSVKKIGNAHLFAFLSGESCKLMGVICSGDTFNAENINKIISKINVFDTEDTYLYISKMEFGLLYPSPNNKILDSLAFNSYLSWNLDTIPDKSKKIYDVDSITVYQLNIDSFIVGLINVDFFNRLLNRSTAARRRLSNKNSYLKFAVPYPRTIPYKGRKE